MHFLREKNKISWGNTCFRKRNFQKALAHTEVRITKTPEEQSLMSWGICLHLGRPQKCKKGKRSLLDTLSLQWQFALIILLMFLPLAPIYWTYQAHLAIIALPRPLLKSETESSCGCRKQESTRLLLSGSGGIRLTMGRLKHRLRRFQKDGLNWLVTGIGL